MSTGFLLTGTYDGSDSSKQENPSTKYSTIPRTSNSVYVNVRVNGKQHQAVIDTGSAVTIINKNFLKKIYHKDFIYETKAHKSANCSNINVTGEIPLHMQIQGYKASILAHVTTNVITDLLLGNDWITANNVIIDSHQRRIFLTDQHRHVLAKASFVKTLNSQIPVPLAEQITLPSYSEKYVKIKVLPQTINRFETLFEPTPYLQSKQIILANALITVDNNMSSIPIINANNHQKTLSKNTMLGHISYEPFNGNQLILPILSAVKSTPSTRSTTELYKRDNSIIHRSWAPSIPKQRKVRTRNYL